MPWFFAFFLVSGFCSLVYQVVWLRLAMASFGVTTPVVSLVLSLFMAGLGLGSLVAGRWMDRHENRPASGALRIYALIELLIGASAVAAPLTMSWGRGVLRGLGPEMELGSGGYYALTGGLLGLAMLPWCFCMGMTFPVAMAAIRRARGPGAESSFSYLYLANLLGALAGTLVSAFVLIELFGFRGTLFVAMAANVALAVVATVLSRRAEWNGRPTAPAQAGSPESESPGSESRAVPEGGVVALVLLFLTGLASMAMEVAWVRQFTPFLGTVVYAFASILAIYLVSTYLGSALYRLRLSAIDRGVLGGGWIFVGVLSFLPLFTADHRLPLGDGMLLGVLRLALGIGPFCAALGFLTPMLVDRWSAGDPRRAGSAYAVNVLGSLIGPLVAGFVLLPTFGERGALLLLGAPLFAVGFAAVLRPSERLPLGARRLRFGVTSAVAVLLALGTQDFADQFEHKEVRHDATATVIATGEGMERRLLVNGVGITEQTPMTKVMAHLPMAWRSEAPKNALVICFGMGTSFRSLDSWGVPTTGVELVPSVPGLFGYFHDDADEVAGREGNRIVVDDGRRFLERTDDVFDVITLDPPPPAEAAGSSLLYSVEFYELIEERLSSDGILQQWCPTDAVPIELAVFEAITQVFEHVLIFRGMDGWGFHYLASKEPLGSWTAEELAAHMPEPARADLVEWGPEETAEEMFARVLAGSFPSAQFHKFERRPLADDRPVNEYYFLRRTLKWYPKPVSAD